jgi:hypothetical protein
VCAGSCTTVTRRCTGAMSTEDGEGVKCAADVPRNRLGREVLARGLGETVVGFLRRKLALARRNLGAAAPASAQRFEDCNLVDDQRGFGGRYRTVQGNERLLGSQ